MLRTKSALFKKNSRMHPSILWAKPTKCHSSTSMKWGMALKVNRNTTKTKHLWMITKTTNQLKRTSIWVGRSETMNK